MAGRKSSVVNALAGVALFVSAVALISIVGGSWWSKRSALLGPSTWSAIPEVLSATPAPAFLVETLDGDTVAAPRSGSRSLLIAYKTTCRFCEASLRNWQRVVAEICDDVQVVLVSNEPISVQQQYWQSKRAFRVSECDGRGPVIGRVVDVREFAEGYGIRATPIHLVIDEDGHVIRTWRGAVGRRAGRDSLIAALR